MLTGVELIRRLRGSDSLFIRATGLVSKIIVEGGVGVLLAYIVSFLVTGETVIPPIAQEELVSPFTTIFSSVFGLLVAKAWCWTED